MQIPYDAILVPDSSGVLTNEAAMAGVSDEMKKDTPDMCIQRWWGTRSSKKASWFPLAVMISQAYSVRKMLKDMNFVTRLASCEIMGGVNNICSDKTGSLTMNKMHVTNVWHGEDAELP